jgi:hypothetical protein
MSTIERKTRPRAGEPAPPTGAEVMQAMCDDSGRLVRRAGWGVATLIVLIAAGVCAGGCGNRSGDHSAVARAPQPAVVTPSGGGGVLASVASTPSHETREPASEALAAASVDSLPPDVAATLSDEKVFTGTSVEITAKGSPDVDAVVLGDGNGGRAPFAYDSSADLWRVAYRVPVSPKSDRLALSVTARNAAGRWRRVWVFMNVEKETATADSISTDKR